MNEVKGKIRNSARTRKRLQGIARRGEKRTSPNPLPLLCLMDEPKGRVDYEFRFEL